MSERQTDEMLDDVERRIHANVCYRCEGAKQLSPGYDCFACEGTGMFALSSSFALDLIAELRERRAADLTNADQARHWQLETERVNSLRDSHEARLVELFLAAFSGPVEIAPDLSGEVARVVNAIRINVRETERVKQELAAHIAIVTAARAWRVGRDRAIVGTAPSGGRRSATGVALIDAIDGTKSIDDDIANERQVSEALAKLVNEIEHDISIVVRHREARTSGGQHVGTGGPLGGANPSTIVYLERFVRDMRRVMERAAVDVPIPSEETRSALANVRDDFAEQIEDAGRDSRLGDWVRIGNQALAALDRLLSRGKDGR